MKRVVWFTLGATVAAVVMWQGAKLYRKSVPVAVQEKLAETSHDVSTRVRGFVSTLTEAMAEREAELNEALGIDEPAAASARSTAAAARRAMRA